MKKIKRRICAVILSLAAVLNMGSVLCVNGADPATQIVTYDAGLRYAADKAPSEVIRTLEVTVQYPEDYTQTEYAYGEVILGNYYMDEGVSINLEVTAKGYPRLLVRDEIRNSYEFNLDSVSLFDGNENHLAIVMHDPGDGTGTQFLWYVNGILKYTKVLPYYMPEIICDNPFCIGGDWRSGNIKYSRGYIKNVAAYSDERTAAEIASDVTNYGTDNLIFAYAMEYTGELPSMIADLSGNGYDLKKTETWTSDHKEITDYAYSFAVLGDTQIMNYYYPDAYNGIFDWIVANAEAKKMEMVLGVGDITEDDKDYEWLRAVDNHKKLDAINLPYSIVIGNHDGHRIWADNFNKYFNDTNYSSHNTQINGGFYEEGNAENTWRTFTVCGNKYLLLTLDYGPSDDVLKWAGKVVKTHKDYNVIVSTHAYMYLNGTTHDENERWAPTVINSSTAYNNGEDIWNKLIRKYENITLVLCGHIPYDGIQMVQAEGDNGNMVTQLLINPQDMDAGTTGGTGTVTMLYFSEDGKTVQTEYYSTVKNQYFAKELTFELHTVDPTGDSSSGGSASLGESGSESTEDVANSTGFNPFTGDHTILTCIAVLAVVSISVSAFLIMKKGGKLRHNK